MLCAVLLPAPVSAAETLQAGLWQLTSKRERDGVTTERPPVTRCITPEQAKDMPRQSPPDMAKNPNCSTSDFKHSGNTVSWHMQCTGTPAVDTGVEYTVADPQHYAATFKTTVTLGKSTTSSVLHVQGTRTGECPK